MHPSGLRLGAVLACGLLSRVYDFGIDPKNFKASGAWEPWYRGRAPCHRPSACLPGWRIQTGACGGPRLTNTLRTDFLGIRYGACMTEPYALAAHAIDRVSTSRQRRPEQPLNPLTGNSAPWPRRRGVLIR